MDTVVDLWWADLRQADLALRDTLPEAEAARLAELDTDADRARRLVGAALLQRAFRHGRNLPATATVEIERSCDRCGEPHGRPRAADGRGPNVSVSHSGLLIVAAACATARVGVDVQRADGDEADWVADEARLKTGSTTDDGTLVRLTAPLPGYAAALAVGARGDVRVTLH